jgi:hypothetical protein
VPCDSLPSNEDVCVAFSFEASMLSVGWHVLWNVTD